MTRVVISQPMYFPWSGFFEQMALADVFIWLDDAQFSKGSFTNRVQVKLEGGRVWMSIALERKGSMTPILDLRPAKAGWENAHREVLRQSFRKAPYSAEALGIFDAALCHETLADKLIASAEEAARALNVTPARILRSSTMGAPGESWRRVLDLVKAVGGTKYITGHGAAHYLDHGQFEAEGVVVEYMDYSLTPWPQDYGEFTPFVTVLDLIAARGDQSAAALQPSTVPWRQFVSLNEY